MNDPTRGVDLGAKRDLYALLRSWPAQGVAIVMLSTEVDEHVELMDRVLVFREHELSVELPREQLSRDALVSAFFGERAWCLTSTRLLRTRYFMFALLLAVLLLVANIIAEPQLRQAEQLAQRAGGAGAVRAGRDGFDAVDRQWWRRAGHLGRSARRASSTSS